MLAAAQCQTSSPKNQTAQNRGTDVRDDIPQDIPEIDRNHVPLWPDHETSTRKDHALVTASLHLGMIKIEKLRGNQDLAHTDLLSEISYPPRSMTSPSRRDDFTPTGSGVLPTPDQATSIGHVSSDPVNMDLSFLDQDDDTPIGELRISIPIADTKMKVSRE
uniref:Uncharacterized protein n=1 Tax=Solanum tuberosum TaxID=4113 RepID=M1AY93_SOLTU